MTKEFGDAVEVAQKPYAALEGADGLIVCTEWNEFRRPDLDRIGELLKEKVVFDGRNIYSPRMMERAGFRYYSIGRQPVG